MRLLLDSHTAVWWAQAHPKLSVTARDALNDPANTRVISAASVWELTIKRKSGKYGGVDLIDVLATADVEELPITAAHGRLAGDLPPHHGDPFDRVMVAQALLEHLVLVTSDRRLAAYGCATLW